MGLAGIWEDLARLGGLMRCAAGPQEAGGSVALERLSDPAKPS